jgi:hypothetical protein
VSVAETASTLTNVGVLHASAAGSARASFDYEPRSWTDAVGWSIRRKRLKDKYGRYGAMPKKWNEVPERFLEALDPDVQRQCRELFRLGLERMAIRQAYCGKLGRVYECQECGRPGKRVYGCKNAMCRACAPKNFDALFKRFLEVENLISPAVRSLPGWTWNVLDFSFRHDGDFPSQAELRQMVKAIRLTVERAVKEACREWHHARQGCRLRLNEDGTPMMSRDGWPIGGARDGSARELVGWTALRIMEHEAPDNEARKRGERGTKRKIPERWRLRFGYELIRVREFGFDNVNAHFHSAYFGPRLDYWYDPEQLKKNHRLICSGRLVEIFKEESRKALGEESYTVFFDKGKSGFPSVLAHALKYTKKIPTSTPEGLAQLAYTGRGTRRVALLGAHYGVPLKSKPYDPKCSFCGSSIERLDGLGLVPLTEIEDLPDLIEEPSHNPYDDHCEPGADESRNAEVRGP